MSRPPHRRTALGLILAALALPRAAAARALGYRLDPARSRVGFGFLLVGTAQTGEMPVAEATILIDTADLAGSRVDVSIDATRARTGLILAAGALRGRSMLDAASYPRLHFVSTAVRPSPSGRLSDGARIEGRLTIRDVTRDITLDANLTRAAGTAPDDLRELTIRLSGHVSRAAFGITGYPDVVADIVTLDIVATLLAED